MSMKHHLHTGVSFRDVERVCDKHSKEGWRVAAMLMTHNHDYTILFERPDELGDAGRWRTTEDRRW